MAPDNLRQSRRTRAGVEGRQMPETLALPLQKVGSVVQPAEHDPIALFEGWFAQARSLGVKQPEAMTLATVDENGWPQARTLLLKGVDRRGFVFFTNLRSAKGRALEHEPRVALCFYWPDLDKQVRVCGRAQLVSDAEADAYFATRPRLSQISAWASRQSKPMRGYFELEAEVLKTTLRFGLGSIPRPPFWSGYRVVPEQIECWIQKPFRRHRRILYTRAVNDLLPNEAALEWRRSWLYP